MSRAVWLGILIVLAPHVSPRVEGAQADYEQQVQEGTRLHDAGDFAGAMAVYRRVLRAHPKDARVLYEIAYSSMAAGQYKEAIAYAKRSLSASPDYAAACYAVMGGAHDLLGQWRKGEEVLRTGLVSFPDNSLLRFNLGINLQGQGNVDGAVSELQEALRLNPQHAGSWRALGQASERRGRRARAFAAYLRFLAIELDSQRSTPLANRLWDLLFAGVKHEPASTAGGKANTTITSDTSTSGDKDDQGTSEALIMQIVAASRYLDEHKGESDVAFFAHALEKVLTILWELDQNAKVRDTFWSTYVIAYFRDAGQSGHLPTLAYDVRRSLRNEEISRWLDEHGQEVERYRAWTRAWQPGRG